VEGIIRAGNRVKALEHQGRNERRRARRAARLRGEVTA